jgi:hypothetical protein
LGFFRRFYANAYSRIEDLLIFIISTKLQSHLSTGFARFTGVVVMMVSVVMVVVTVVVSVVVAVVMTVVVSMMMTVVVTVMMSMMVSMVVAVVMVAFSVFLMSLLSTEVGE